MDRTASRVGILLLLSTLVIGSCNFLQVANKPDDQAITSDVQANLFADPVLKTRDIRVTSESGVVTLSGSVGTDLEKAAAVRLAGKVKGVSQVVDQLEVQTAVAEASTEPATEAPAQDVFTAKALPPATKTPRTKTYRNAAPEPSAAPAAMTPGPAETAHASEPAPPPASTPVAEPPPPPQPQTFTIPAGTVVTVRMVDAIDSSRHRPGEEFAATVDAPIAVGERVIIPRGSDARVRLIESQSAGRIKGQSELQVELVGVAVDNMTYAVETSVVEKKGASEGKRTAATVGGGAVLGGLIGAVAGKGKGAAIGAAVGAGAGTAVGAATKGQQVNIPSEAKLDFTLKVPLSVTKYPAE
ncbi:MAG TPA: BON domain-containing protein [Terriglobia bacterium]|nr:BON domain-containing protein [Terriglobia bacterium]